MNSSHRDHDAFVTALEQRCKVVVVSIDPEGLRLARICVPLGHELVDTGTAPTRRYYFMICDGRDADGSQVRALTSGQITSIRLTSDRYGATSHPASFEAPQQLRSEGGSG